MSRQPTGTCDSKEFGQMIRSLREASTLPQRKVAAALDIDTSTLSKIERGDRQPNQAMISKLALLFGVSSEDLMVAHLSDRIVLELKDLGCLERVLEAALTKARLGNKEVILKSKNYG